MSAKRHDAVASLLRDTRGAAYLEYLVTFALVGLATALALSRIAPSIVRDYSQQRQVLYLQSP